MRTCRIIIFIFALGVFYGCTVSGNKSEKESSIQSQKDNSILWEISGEDVVEKSYLLGTHHIVNYHYLDTLPGFKRVMENVDAIVVEHDGAVFSESALKAYFDAKNRKYPSYAFMPKGVKNYEDIYASKEELYYVERFIRKFKKERNAPQFNLEELRPIYTMMILQSYYLFVNMLERSYSTSLPVDYVQMDIGIGNEAQKRGKRLIYLETLEDRTDEKDDSLYIDTCNLTRQSHYLYMTCKNLALQKERKRENAKTPQPNTNKSVDFYLKGELDSLYMSVEKMTSPPSDYLDEYQQKGQYNLVAGRNKKWIPVIDSNVKESSCLIAVGVGHLPGEEGLINLLRKEGYNVKPVNIYGIMRLGHEKE